MEANASKGLVEKVSRLILCLWAGIVVIRLLVAPLDNYLLFTGLACISVFFCCHLFILQIRNNILAGTLLMFVLGGSLLVLAWLSGGVKSPSLIMYPLIPIIAALLFGRALSWSLSSIMSLSAILFYLIEIRSADLATYGGAEELRDRLTTSWVVFSTTACTVFANFFHTENRRLNNALENQARIDYLTELPNKRAIEESLRREAALAKRTGGWISVIMLDIDFFKQFNDTHGHSSGDDCLKAIAQTLRESLKRADDFIGRYGGEEFIVILPDTDPDSCMRIAEILRRDVENLYITRRGVVPEIVTITVGGFTTTGDNLKNVDDLVTQADRALYEGKRMGRNRVICSKDKEIVTPQGVTDLNERRLRRKGDS